MLSSSAGEVAHTLPEYLVVGIDIDRRGERTGVTRESLREEEVSAGAIDVRHRRVPQRVHGVEPIKPRPLLPGTERDLDAAVGDAVAGLAGKQRCINGPRAPVT